MLLLLVFLTEMVFCVLLGVKDWQEIIGVMKDKESQADEEILIYAMTLINKVRSKLHHNFVVRKNGLWLEHTIPVKESL